MFLTIKKKNKHLNYLEKLAFKLISNNLLVAHVVTNVIQFVCSNFLAENSGNERYSRKILLILIKYSRVSRSCDQWLRPLREDNFFAQGIEEVGNYYCYEREEEDTRMKYW